MDNRTIKAIQAHMQIAYNKSRSKPKVIGSWGDQGSNSTPKPVDNRKEKLQFLNGMQIGMVLGSQAGKMGVVFPDNKMLDFSSMSDSELNTHLDRYTSLIDQELGKESNNKSNTNRPAKVRQKGTFAKAIAKS